MEEVQNNPKVIVKKNHINVIDKVFESYSNNNSEFSKIHSKLSKLEKINVAPNRLSNDDGKILYSIIRIKNPKNIIETGVATGYSSSIVLMALNENHHGYRNHLVNEIE